MTNAEARMTNQWRMQNDESPCRVPRFSKGHDFMPRISRLLPLLVLLFLAQNAYADGAWQSLFFEPHTFVRIWWVIPLGLLIEWPAVRKMTMFPWKKCLWVTVCMNAFSFIAGMFLQAPTMLMRGSSFLIAILTLTILGSTLLEGYIINRFKKNAFNLKTAWLLLLVNAISGGGTIAALFYWAW
jgi:hypothetical protein